MSVRLICHCGLCLRQLVNGEIYRVTWDRISQPTYVCEACRTAVLRGQRVEVSPPPIRELGDC